MSRTSVTIQWLTLIQDHILLSGGLGSSKYIQREISSHVAKSKLGALQQAKLHQSTEPQLSVCHGLIEQAVQCLESSTMFRSRLSRTSLGVPCRVRCKTLVTGHKKNLQRQAEAKGRVETDANGQRWMKGYMDWFVKWVSETKMIPFRCRHHVLIT